MAVSFGFFRCTCGCGFRYAFGQTAFYCPRCGKQWQPNPRSHPVQYSTKPFPRGPWIKMGGRTDPFPPRPPAPPQLSTNPYQNPPYKPPTIQTPAQVGVLDSGPPVLLQPDPSGTPIPGHSVATVTPAAPALGGIIFWVAFTLTMIVIAGAIIAQPRLVGDAINWVSSLSSGGSSGGSTDACAATHNAYSSIGDCSPSNGQTNPGYEWCIVTERGGGEGQTWVLDQCVP